MKLPSLVVLLLASDSVRLKIKETDLPRLHKIIPDGTHSDKNGSLEVTWPAVRAMLEAANR